MIFGHFLSLRCGSRQGFLSNLFVFALSIPNAQHKCDIPVPKILSQFAPLVEISFRFCYGAK